MWPDKEQIIYCRDLFVIDRFSVNRKIFVVGFGLYGSIHIAADYLVNIQVTRTLMFTAYLYVNVL